MATKKEKKEERITVEITGPILQAAMELRAIRERDSGKPTSLAGVVREAILSQLRKEKGEAVEQ